MVTIHNSREIRAINLAAAGASEVSDHLRADFCTMTENTMETTISASLMWKCGEGAQSPAAVENIRKPARMESTQPVQAQGNSCSDSSLKLRLRAASPMTRRSTKAIEP